MPVGMRSPPRFVIDDAELEAELEVEPDVEVDPERVVSLDCAWVPMARSRLSEAERSM